MGIVSKIIYFFIYIYKNEWNYILIYENHKEIWERRLGNKLFNFFIKNIYIKKGKEKVYNNMKIEGYANE